MLAAEHTTSDAPGYILLATIVLIAIWANVWSPPARRERLRRLDPRAFWKLELDWWLARNPAPAPSELVPLDRACDRCGLYPIHGSKHLSGGAWWRVPRNISAEEKRDLQMGWGGPRIGWTRCPNCRVTKAELVEQDTRWMTIEQKERAELERQRAEARKRREFAIKRDHEERRKKKLSTMKGLKSLTPSQFERAVGKILEVNGYSAVVVSGKPGDLTADILCTDSEGRRVVVQCKRYVDKPVGSKELQSFIGMMRIEHGADRGLYVTTSTYTRPATDLASRHDVELVDGERLVELAQCLHESWDDSEIQNLLKDPPKPPSPPAPDWVREWRARERRKGR